MQEIIEDSSEKTRKIGLLITLAVCAVGTIIALIFFSQEGFHQRTDALFGWFAELLADFFNNGWGGFVVLAGALVVPLVTLLLLPAIDVLTRLAPAGGFLLNHVKLNFENHSGVRFLPSFLVSIYFIIGSFMRNDDKMISFDPDNYNLFAGHGAGERLNIIFMALTVFSLLLIIAEGIISAGPWGMIIHIPLVLAANVYFVALVTAIMAFIANILGILVSAIAMSIVAPIFIIMAIIAIRRT